MGPINGRDMWPTGGYPLLLPPDVKKRAGRPKKARRREPEEEGPKENQTRLSKKGVKMTCSNCGKTGHNKRGCKNVSTIGGEANAAVGEETDGGGGQAFNVPIYPEVTSVGSGWAGGVSSSVVNSEVASGPRPSANETESTGLVDVHVQQGTGHTMMWRGTKLFLTSTSPDAACSNFAFFK